MKINFILTNHCDIISKNSSDVYKKFLLLELWWPRMTSEVNLILPVTKMEVSMQKLRLEALYMKVVRKNSKLVVYIYIYIYSWAPVHHLSIFD